MFDKIVAAIKKNLPNAGISFDMSPWIGEDEFKDWWSYFSSSKEIDYIHTSGGKTFGKTKNKKY